MDLFEAIKALYRKEEIPKPPSDFMLHRFLASEKIYAPFCKEISLHVFDRYLVWEIWKTALPRAARAPFFTYPAPKKKRIDHFTEELADRLDTSLAKSEDIVDIINLIGNREEVASYYGIDENGN